MGGSEKKKKGIRESQFLVFLQQMALSTPAARYHGNDRSKWNIGKLTPFSISSGLPQAWKKAKISHKEDKRDRKKNEQKKPGQTFIEGSSLGQDHL